MEALTSNYYGHIQKVKAKHIISRGKPVMVEVIDIELDPRAVIDIDIDYFVFLDIKEEKLIKMHKPRGGQVPKPGNIVNVGWRATGPVGRVWDINITDRTQTEVDTYSDEALATMKTYGLKMAVELGDPRQMKFMGAYTIHVQTRMKSESSTLFLDLEDGEFFSLPRHVMDIKPGEIGELEIKEVETESSSFIVRELEFVPVIPFEAV